MRHSTPRRGTGVLLSGTVLVSGTILGLPTEAIADCSFAPPSGNDSYVCDSGTSVGGLVDPGGNNTLLFPSGGTGTLNGNVTFGTGADGIAMTSGTITGSVDLGAGADSLVISDGRIVGNVQQGDGIDEFRISGGEVGSLNQGDNLDTFTMSGGRIVDAFDDGDRAVMTGGRIGRVNMKLDNNLFDMSGGTIDRNLVTGFGNDTIILSDGTIGGNISVSGGTDRVTVTGGTVGGDIRMSFGTDAFEWSGGGIVYGTIDLGGDDDSAALTNLADANIGATPAISGGLGVDRLALDNVKTGDVSRFDSWEAIDLTNDTELVFADRLTLGDSGTGTGTLDVDATSTIFGGGIDGGIASFTPGAHVSVINAGRIDLTNGAVASDTFTIAGDYRGDRGLLFVDTVLGDDASASDRLVVDGGAASGATGLAVVEAGGAGDVTTQDGIMVVEAVNGATTDRGAFALTGRVAAGAFDYFLFKGGISDGTEDNWYLRSALVTPPPLPGPDPTPPPLPAPAPGPLGPSVAEPEPEAPEVLPPPPPSELPGAPLPSEGTETEPPVDPTPPVVVTDPEPEAPPAPPPVEPADPPPPPPALPTLPAPVPSPVAPPPTPGATPVVAEVVPLYRVEVATYAAIPPIAHYLALSTLGTFHERRGDQALLRGAGTLPAAWFRAFGQHADLKWGGTVEPSVEGDLFGFQVGQDIIGRESDDGHYDRVGLLFGYAHMDGDVKGQALGWNDLAVGSLDASGTSFGGYWTHVAPEGWYLDGVLMATWYGGDASATTGESVDIDGTGFTASLEGGYPVALGGRWTIEPQGQLIWNRLSLDDQSDGISSVAFDTDDTVTGRVGFRMAGDGGTVRPYFKVNLWHDFAGDDTVSFGTTPIVTELDGTSLEVGGGVVADLNDRLSLFATADYSGNLGGEATRIFEGNFGLNLSF